jgi:hypothetical protein
MQVFAYFQIPTGARGQRRASRNHEALVFSWDGAGKKLSRLSLRKSRSFRLGKAGSRPVLSEIAPPSPRPVQVFAKKMPKGVGSQNRFSS